VPRRQADRMARCVSAPCPLKDQRPRRLSLAVQKRATRARVYRPRMAVPGSPPSSYAPCPLRPPLYRLRLATSPPMAAWEETRWVSLRTRHRGQEGEGEWAAKREREGASCEAAGKAHQASRGWDCGKVVEAAGRACRHRCFCQAGGGDPGHSARGQGCLSPGQRGNPGQQ